MPLHVVSDYHPLQRVQRTCTVRDSRRLFIADNRRESRRVALAIKPDTGQNKAACVDGIPQGVAPHTLARISRLILTLKLRDVREKHAHFRRPDARLIRRERTVPRDFSVRVTNANYAVNTAVLALNRRNHLDQPY